MSAYFVTATGTDIGKTFVTAGLVRHLRESGEKVSALKPVATGFDIATAAVSDPGILLEALDIPITPEAIERIAPFRFAAALSPDMAAARENRKIDFDALVAQCRDAIKAEQGALFIEGVGGAMAPVAHSHTNLDWMTALKLPLVVVTGSYLGTISHTLTTLDVLARRDLRVAALVVNDSGDGAVPIADTLATLKRFVSAPIATIPRVKTWIDARPDFGRLWNLISTRP